MLPDGVHVAATVVWLALLVATILPILDLFGGKTGAEGKEKANRRHRRFGWAFVVLYVLLAASMVARYVGKPVASPLGALHGVLALGLLPMLALKVGIVRRWTTMNRFLPPLGMSVFAVAFVVGTTGLLMGASGLVAEEAPERASRLEGAPLVAEGRHLVGQWCSRCHAADRVYGRSGRKTRAEWVATFDRMAARDPSLERVRRPILAFLEAELASDPVAPAAGTGAGSAPPGPPPPPVDDHGRGRGRGGDDR